MQNFVTSDECSTKMSKHHRVRCFVSSCFVLLCFAYAFFFFFENFRFRVTRSLNNLDDNTTREISFEFLKAGKTWFPWVHAMGDGDKTWYWIIVLRWIVLIIHRPTRANFRIKVDLALGTTRVNVGLPNLGVTENFWNFHLNPKLCPEKLSMHCDFDLNPNFIRFYVLQFSKLLF